MFSVEILGGKFENVLLTQQKFEWAIPNKAYCSRLVEISKV